MEDTLQSVDAYTKHKPYKRRFPRRKTQTWGIDKQWQLDLIEMLPFKKYNKGYSYIMVAIDVFSRYAFAEAIKSKQGKDVTEAFKSMIKERRPLNVQTDKGKEFLNKHFKNLLKETGITFFTGENSDIKCSLAERFNSTLQIQLLGASQEHCKMDLTLNLPSNASGDILRSNTLTSYRVMLQ